eukprot:NODE_6130_length_1702_cov_4.597460.p1 GENE.NODE_6130_length_1702_cov_4.597460~~NODE_6130_length_1702_cov_4.597460.p1  ORF type:complete len:312 (-),score=88.84 NODE_6130_length_1702_cov_4.597460:710-1645(-)
MMPAVNPPKEIDDPTDSKPEDWVDEEKIDDPEVMKPSDWEEDSMIPDPKASMPAGWVEDAPKLIPDPDATIPSDWDVEEDGEWEPQMIENPVCSVGCGQWVARTIVNPKYTGKRSASRIDNPAYIGKWTARQLPNPDYFHDESPGILPRINAVGIDVWQMSKNIIFDNLVISTDPEKAQAFLKETWSVRKDIEELISGKPLSGPGLLAQIMQYAEDPRVLVSGIVGFISILAYFCFCRRGRPAAAGTVPRRVQATESAGEPTEHAADTATTTAAPSEGGGEANAKKKDEAEQNAAKEKNEEEKNEEEKKDE